MLDKPLAAGSVSELTGDRIPLGPAQMGVYFDHVRHADKRRYNIGQITSIYGAVDVDRFRLAARQVVAANAALNMSIRDDEKGPCQVYDADALSWIPPDDLLPFHDLRDCDDVDAACREIVEEALWQPFDLHKAPLFRWVLIRTGQDEFQWLQVYHHIVTDGWSRALILDQVSQAYSDPSSSAPAPEEGLQSYLKHLAAEQAYKDSPAALRDGAFWRALLSDAALAEPFETIRERTTRTPFLREHVVLDTETCDAVGQAASALGVASGLILMAAVAVLEARLSQNSDVVLGVPLLGRSGKEARKVVSMSSNL